MMHKEIDYGFWFWSDKLLGVLTMLSHLAGCQIGTEELEYLKQELQGTNDEENRWISYNLNGSLNSIKLSLAYDAEEGNDMIHLKIQATEDLMPKLEALDLFQSLFKQLEVADK